MPSLVYADGSTYATAVLSDHPVAFYQFGDTVGSASFADSSGSGNTATSNGSDHIVAPGPFGESTQALSIGNDGAQAPQLAPMQGDNSRTVEFWFNTTRTDDQCLLTAGSTSRAQSFSLCLTDGQQYHAPPPNTPGVYLQTWDADVYVPNLALTDGKWHYLAVALSGSTVTLNVDGSAPSGGFIWNGSAYSGFTTQPFTLPTQPDTASTPVGIGSKGWAAAFMGEIADVAIYPAALTEGQITAHHSSGLGKKLPPVITTTHERNPQEKTEPPGCSPALPQPSIGRHQSANQLVHSITRGAKKLLHAKSVRVNLSVQLCGASAGAAGVQPGTKLSGVGIIDASRARASWTVMLPSSLGGHLLYVISHGDETYLRAASLGLHVHKPWVRVRSREFRNMRRLGFLGVLAIDTNPAAMVGIATDTAPESAKAAMVHEAGSLEGAPRQAEAASSSCDVSGGATLSGPLDLSNDKAIVDRAKAWKDAASTIRSSLKGTQAAVRLNRGDTLTSVTFATLQGQTAGLTVTDDLCPEAKHDSGTDPVTSSIPKLGSVFAVDPCLVGDWFQHQVYGETLFGAITGSVTLAITPTGATSMQYMLSEPSPPLTPPYVYESPDFSVTITHFEVDPPITVIGIATGEVLAPLFPNQSSHRLVWAMASSTVTSHLPGYRTEETGEEAKYLFEPPDVTIRDVIPFDRTRESPPWDYLDPQTVNSTKYECDEKQGIATLKLELPYESTELEFVRPGRRSEG